MSSTRLSLRIITVLAAAELIPVQAAFALSLSKSAAAIKTTDMSASASFPMVTSDSIYSSFVGDITTTSAAVSLKPGVLSSYSAELNLDDSADAVKATGGNSNIAPSAAEPVATTFTLSGQGTAAGIAGLSNNGAGPLTPEPASGAMLAAGVALLIAMLQIARWPMSRRRNTRATAPLTAASGIKYRHAWLDFVLPARLGRGCVDCRRSAPQ